VQTPNMNRIGKDVFECPFGSADRPHPEQGYRSCLGILRLAKRYGAVRLEAACTRAVAVRARSYRRVGQQPPPTSVS
jgi:transposase